MQQDVLRERKTSGGFFSGFGSLEKVRGVLNKIQNPQTHLNNVILVGGTIGKTTVAKYLFQILSCAGYKVNVLLANHSFNLKERIILQNNYIEYGALSESTTSVQSISSEYGAHVNFFETMVLIGATLFPKVASDAVIIEYGIGHRDDPVNIFQDCNVISQIITKIDVDHEHLLGSTVELNAMHHACTIKPNTTIISMVQRDSVCEMLNEVCKSQNNKLVLQGRDYWLDEGSDKKGSFTFSTQTEYMEIPNISLFSNNEKDHIATAIMVATENKNEFPKVSSPVIELAIKNMSPSEIFTIKSNALDSLLNKESEILFIPVSNVAGARLLIKNLKQKSLSDLRPKINYGIVCVEHDTNGIAMLLATKSLFTKITVMDFADFDSFIPKEDVVKNAASKNIILEKADSIEQAIEAMVLHNKNSLRIVIFGSPMIGAKIKKYFS